MQSEDAAEPVEWDVEELRLTIHEWESVASQILEHLAAEAHGEACANWRPHVGQMTKAVRTFRDFCCEHRQALGLWREDGLAPDEAYEIVWDEADRLVQWLNRMMR